MAAEGESHRGNSDTPDFGGGDIAHLLFVEAVEFHQALNESRLHDKDRRADDAEVDNG
jgi:hypothetical protein